MSSTVTVRGASNSQTLEVIAGSALVRPYGPYQRAIALGNAFSWSSLTYNYTAKDTILGVENNSSALDLYIQTIHITGQATSQWVVHTASGVTMAGGNAVVGVNLNRNSGLVAAATAFDNESGNGGADSYTTRLAVGRILASGLITIDVDGGIVLPNDHMIGVDLTTVGTAANVTIIGYFQTKST